jgi:DNA topoisomerase-1
VPKARDPKTLTLEECKELLLAAPVRGRRGKKKAARNGTAEEAAVKKTAAKKAAGKKAKKKKAGKKRPAKKAGKAAAKRRTGNTGDSDNG